MSSKRLLFGGIAFLLSLFFFISPAWSQNRVVTGKITDNKDGTPIAGASVMPKGSTSGTFTNSDGNFSLAVPSGVRTLVISSVGFSPREVSITGKSVDVSLTSLTASLNEVVIIGYGTARKKDLTGSITTISSKDFVRGPVVTPEQLIAGKIAGVKINSNDGMPGSGSRIRIRGGSSLNASNDPLIVIDGVPLDNNSINGAPSPLSLINPNDIESFNVLKDASAAAIYGSRAANGVLIITTKKGRTGKLNVSFNSLNSVSVKTGEINILSPDQFRTLVNKFGSNSDKALLGTDNTNWQDKIYRSAISTDNNIALSGGVPHLPYRFSLGYLDQNGILKRSNLQRTSISLNLSPKLLDNHLSINTNIKYSYTKNFFANQGAIGAAVYFDPTKPVYSGKTDFGGYYEWLVGGTMNGLATKNPLGLLNERNDKSNVNRLIGNIQLDYKLHFFPDLHANLNLGYDRSHGKGNIFVPAYAAQDFARGGRINQYEQTKDNKLLEFYLNYLKDVSIIKSHFDVTAGYSYQDWLTKAPAFADLRADGTVFKAAGTPFETQNTLISFYGRLNYALMDRYLLTFTMRRDGSSRFSPSKRWGNFPSAAGAWKISDESFLRNSNVISNLKVRLGWGVTGQQDIFSDYPYQPNIFYGDSAAQYQFGGQYYVVARPQAYDANLKWEETESRNLGLDVGFAQNRYNFSVDFYQKDTRDLLAVVPAPAGTNFSNQILTNVGSMTNQGLEFTLNVSPVRNRDFSIDLGYNLTYIIKSDITKLQLVNDPTYLGADVGSIGINGTIQKHTVGQNPYSFFLYKQVYDSKGKPIEGLFEDKNGDGVINDFDKYWVKNPEPKVFMGFSANANYKRFGAGFVMRAEFGNYVYNNVKAGSAILQNVITGQNYLSNAQTDILVSGFNSRQTWSDYYLENGSFLRMDNIYINYNFGKVWQNKANLRVSANCQNVFVVTKYSGLDPEVNGGIDGTIFPRPRIYALGINLDF